MDNSLLTLAESVKKMRTAQNEYFRTRTTIALNQSKKLEREVDQMIDQVIKPVGSTQNKLF